MAVAFLRVDRKLPMDPFREESGWEPGTDAEEIRKRVAALRHLLLSEFYQATAARVIRPGWGDPQRVDEAGWIERFAARMNHLILSSSIDCFAYLQRTEAEKIYVTIQELRREIWINKNWWEKNSAKVHPLAERVKAMLDRVDKFLSAGETTLHGHSSIIFPLNVLGRQWRKRIFLLIKSTTCKDSGANVHATVNWDLISDLITEKVGTQVKTANVESPLMSHGCGHVSSENITLPDVHYVPGLGINIVSVYKLTKMDYLLMFGPNAGCSILDKRTDEQHLLSDFFEATTRKVIHTVWGDIQRAEAGGVFMEIADPYHIFPLTPFGLGSTPAEEICFTIKKLRYEIWPYGLSGTKISAKQDGLAKRIRAVHDGASKFLSVTTSSNASIYVINASCPGYALHFICCSVHCPPLEPCVMECVTAPNSIVDRYESGRISEKPKPQSTNTGSACTDVHDLNDAEPENHSMFLASADPIDKRELQQWEDSTSSIKNTLLLYGTRVLDYTFVLKSMATSHAYSEMIDLAYNFSLVPEWGVDLWNAAMGTSKYEDRTSSVGPEGSYVECSVETSPKGGVDINLGSYQIHVPKYDSVHRPLVQMVLFADSLYGAALACLKSIVPKSIFNLYESGRISEKPIPQSTNPNVDDLTHAEPENHGAPDSVDRRICCYIEAEGKTAATWLIDTGAVHHATGKLSLLSGVTTGNDDDLFITTRDGVRMLVHAQGSVITDTVVLPDVWYIPGLTKNVVSASQLNQLGYSIGFTRGTCLIRSVSDDTLIGKGHVSEDGLFETDFLKVS